MNVWKNCNLTDEEAKYLDGFLKENPSDSFLIVSRGTSAIDGVSVCIPGCQECSNEQLIKMAIGGNPQRGNFSIEELSKDIRNVISVYLICRDSKTDIPLYGVEIKQNKEALLSVLFDKKYLILHDGTYLVTYDLVKQESRRQYIRDVSNNQVFYGQFIRGWLPATYLHSSLN